MGKLYGHFEEIAEHFREGDCWYEKHVAAMTEESLHYKSHIAAELAYRDMKNDQLQAALKRIVEAKKKCDMAWVSPNDPVETMNGLKDAIKAAAPLIEKVKS